MKTKGKDLVIPAKTLRELGLDPERPLRIEAGGDGLVVRQERTDEEIDAAIASGESLVCGSEEELFRVLDRVPPAEE